MLAAALLPDPVVRPAPHLVVVETAHGQVSARTAQLAVAAADLVADRDVRPTPADLWAAVRLDYDDVV